MNLNIRLITLYKNKIGGTEKAAETLCSILSNKFNVKIEYAFDYKKNKKISKFDQFVFFLKRVFFAKKNDIYITTDIATYCIILIANYLNRKVKYIIMWEHYPKEKNGRFWLWLEKKLSLSNKADAIVVLNDIEKQKWNEINNVHVISNGIDASADNISDKKYGLVYVGRITKDKGVERLIVNYIEAGNFNEKLYIIGDGEELPNLMDKYDNIDNIIFLGARNDVQDILSKSKIFVSGSYYECFPISVLEAMAQGVPIVSFDNSGGTESVLSKSGAGFIVLNNEEFSNRIQFLLESDNLLKFGLLGKEYVRENYSFSSYEKKWLRLIDEVTTI
ncbi:glycosyltransferase [Photobacterium damselae subsp. damselae]|uniref:glycosyltransferase n=1 Tax=Photobacterium damselae TaxID=38293 RepID=UPI000A2FA5C5|nr:glycosyltransferase [Photobacterium damselae]ARR49874.1 hypothetical protein CAY62_10025 [Photobacterium damselae subsp. damselae]QAY35580.1 glycosyltransferase [Photobacterium damselae subsp. damselae]